MQTVTCNPQQLQLKETVLFLFKLTHTKNQLQISQHASVTKLKKKFNHTQTCTGSYLHAQVHIYTHTLPSLTNRVGFRHTRLPRGLQSLRAPPALRKTRVLQLYKCPCSSLQPPRYTWGRNAQQGAHPRVPACHPQLPAVGQGQVPPGVPGKDAQPGQGSDAVG